MFSWANLALAIVQLLSSLATWLRETTLRKQGETKVQAEFQKGELDAIHEAKQARQEAKLDNSNVPQSDSLPDDGFRRRD